MNFLSMCAAPKPPVEGLARQADKKIFAHTAVSHGVWGRAP